jgi:hypothetical protein
VVGLWDGGSNDDGCDGGAVGTVVVGNEVGGVVWLDWSDDWIMRARDVCDWRSWFWNVDWDLMICCSSESMRSLLDNSM